MTSLFDGWSRGDILSVIAIMVSAAIAISIYFLQKRISDKQKVDHRLEIEKTAGKKLNEILNKKYSRKIQLYNSKLLNKKYFSSNRRSFVWGYPYHGAEFHSINFDGLEFVVNIEEWDGKRFYKVGLIPFDRILGIKPDGDGSFNGMIFFVKPKLIQKDKYAIAYKSYRYYPIDENFWGKVGKPIIKKITDGIKKGFYTSRYHLYYKWRMK